MSKSRSPSSNIPPTGSPSTTSRLDNLLHPTTTIRLPASPPTAFTESPPRRRRAEDSDSEEPMAKRIRRESPAARGRVEARSSPESDSQGDMADNEMDIRAADTQEQSPPAPPPKKKRTRTLTTPHQSAVLHALLAQSRFPTTAMREEVGRSIGLSARKVQIWFQNQRQKARRPRSQGDVIANRPPQYGPFPNAAETSSNVHRLERQDTEGLHYSGHPSTEPQAGPSEPPPRLLGPGMPGAPVGYPSQGYRQVLPAPPSSAPAGDSSFPTGGSSYSRASSPHAYRSPLSTVRPATSQAVGWRERDRDPSRTLPPLLPTRPSSSHPLPSSGGRPLDLPRRSVYNPPRSLSPEQRFAHLPPDAHSRLPLPLPPPFTLQPPPQWDEPSYLLRPSSSSWSRPGSHSTRGRSTSPIAFRRDLIGNAGTGEASGSDSYYLAERSSLPQSASAPSPPRSGRYDPIRATFVPYSTPPTTSPTVSPERMVERGDRSDVDEDPTRKSSPFREDR